MYIPLHTALQKEATPTMKMPLVVYIKFKHHHSKHKGGASLLITLNSHNVQ